MQTESDELMKYYGEKPIKCGYAAVTSAYGLPCKIVIHTVGPNLAIHDQKANKEKLLWQSIKSCFEICYDLGVESIAFCAISTGIFGYDTREAAECFAETMIDVIKKEINDEMKLIRIVNFEEDKT